VLLVSACLWGRATRYDGRRLEIPQELAGLDPAEVLALCPEVLGGLPVPRPPARLDGARPGREGLDVLEGRARLVDARGQDVTLAFVKGAREVLRQALAARVTKAYLKDRSPSCGHDPQGINPRGGPGQGVLAALLLQAGIQVTEVRA
jgi:uncharacterized protein YbbK (DUF523 family)